MKYPRLHPITGIFAGIVFCCILLPFVAVAGQDAESNPRDEVVKTGWTFGALPAISYNSDLGFQYGALVNLF